MRVDQDTGLAWVWHVADAKWVKRFPVDVRALVTCGEVALKQPGEGNGLPPGHSEAGPPSRDSLEALFSVADKPTLRDTCAENDVDWQGADTRETLVAKLIQNGVTKLAESKPDSEPEKTKESALR